MIRFGFHMPPETTQADVEDFLVDLDRATFPAEEPGGTMWPTGRRVAAGTVQRLRPVAVRPRRGGILVNIVLTRELDSARVHRAERVSAIRWQNEVILKDPSEVDAELLAWIREGYARSA